MPQPQQWTHDPLAPPDATQQQTSARKHHAIDERNSSHAGEFRSSGSGSSSNWVGIGSAQLSRVAVGVLTQSKSSARYKALASTWLSLFEHVLIFESHTDVSRVQQIWKYVPQRLHRKYPHALWYLILDDDVFINQRQLEAFIRARDHNELALYGPGFCDWGIKASLKKRIAPLVDVPLPDFIHIVIGGIMLFSQAAVRRFSNANTLMQCIDDLETLHANRIRLWNGLKEDALYNQDWLFCWCLQVRMKGTVYLDNTFEDVDFPDRKCLTLADVARSRVGIHHATPQRMRALWKAYGRVVLSDGNVSTGDDPSLPQDCRISREGKPYHYLPHTMRADKATLERPVDPGECSSALTDAQQQANYPHCTTHMRYVMQHARASPCSGPFGRHNCAGFQLDRADACNVQYYLFCESVFKPLTSQVWCPKPPGYPEHCCYESAFGGAPLPKLHQPPICCQFSQEGGRGGDHGERGSDANL
jgi:hypothetical protein